MTAVYEIFELTLSGPATGNPYLEVSFDAVFSQGARQVRVPGFYDGAGVYRLRFMPDAVGTGALQPARPRKRWVARMAA